MERIVTALMPDRESANRLATDVLADCRCRRADISIDARGLASPSREGAVLVTISALGGEAAFCVSELMRRHGGKDIDARTVPRGKAADGDDIGSLFPYSGPERRAPDRSPSGTDRRRA